MLKFKTIALKLDDLHRILIYGLVKRSAHRAEYLIFFNDLNVLIYVRSVQLEYTSLVCCPHLKVDITLIERVQRMFTKRIPNLRHLTYDETLSSSKLESLEHRRLYLDLVLLYKIMLRFVDINMLDILVSPATERQSLRNNGVGLNVYKPLSSQRMFCFAKELARFGIYCRLMQCCYVSHS